MEKPVYVIRPKITWEVVEVRNGEETVLSALCATEDAALEELREHLEDE